MTDKRLSAKAVKAKEIKRAMDARFCVECKTRMKSDHGVCQKCGHDHGVMCVPSRGPQMFQNWRDGGAL